MLEPTLESAAMKYSWRLMNVDGGFQAFVLEDAGLDERNLTELVSPGVVTTRRGGVSTGGFQGLNVSFRVGDDAANVKENRALIARGLGLEPAACARPEQVHGNLVLKADAPGDYPRADGLVSSNPGVWLSVHVADCVPVFVFAHDLGSIGLAHAGRKGTAAGITTNLINVFRSSFQCSASQMVLAMGPSVGRCCYELDAETASRLRADCVVERRGRLFFDLWKANRLQALEAGIPEGNVVMPPACTSCRADLFFSHRAHKGTTGRQMAIARPGGLLVKRCHGGRSRDS